VLDEQLCERHWESVVGYLAGWISKPTAIARQVWVRAGFYCMLAVSVILLSASMAWRGSLEWYF